MSQIPMAHLENEDEDFLLVVNDLSPVAQRRLKRLKRVAVVSTQEQNLVVERNDGKPTVFKPEPVRPGPGLEGTSANEFGSNDRECNSNSQGLNKKEGGDAEEQSNTHDNSSDLVDEVQREGHDTKDNAEGVEVTKNHGEIEAGKVKKNLRKSYTTEEVKGNKKMRKNSVTTKECVVGATEELHTRKGEAVSSLLEKKKRRKSSHDKSKSSSTSLEKEMEVAASAPGHRGRKKTKKSELEEIHAESQRLLRETQDASFKPQPVVGKSVSSVLEKIRLRKLQLDQKAGNGLAGTSKTPRDYEVNSDNLSDDSDHMEFEDGDKDKDGTLQEDPCMENEGDDFEEVNFTIPPVTDCGIPRTPENNIETSLPEKGSKQDVPEINGALRAPVEDTQDLFCNSQLSYGEDEENPIDSTQEDEVLAPAFLNMNLKLDSHPQEDELSDEDDNKENVDPSPSKPVEASVYSKGAPVKAFVDDEAEDEDEDILVGQDEEDGSDDDGNEDLQDIIATAEEEHPIDHEKRDELHRKWLEQQDAATTGDILLRLRSGWKQRDPRVRKASFLDEEDDVDFDSQEDDMVECDEEPVHCRLVPELAKQGDDDSNVEKLPEKTAVDEDDALESSDDEELEQRLIRQRILEESEEQEVFMSPAEDESSREVFGLIKKVNIASISKKKTKPASTFLETLCSGGNSNASSKSSFLGRAASSSLQLSHKQGLNGSKSFIFGRDDSNSRHGISKAESQGDMDQKENEHSTDTSRKSVSTEAKAKKGESANKKTNNTNDSCSGPSLFEVLRRQTSQMDRTLQSRNTNAVQEYGEVHAISHFAAFKSLQSTRSLKKAG